jgi:hypothetical protein
MLREHSVQPALSVILGTRLARQGIPAALALPSFLQNYLANLVTAAVRLIPLGQTDGQLAIAELEESVLAASAQAENATIDDLGSAAFMVDWPPWRMKRSTRGSFAHDSSRHRGHCVLGSAARLAREKRRLSKRCAKGSGTLSTSS